MLGKAHVNHASVVARFEAIPFYQCVILRDFSPEEPALSKVKLSTTHASLTNAGGITSVFDHRERPSIVSCYP